MLQAWSFYQKWHTHDRVDDWLKPWHAASHYSKDRGQESWFFFFFGNVIALQEYHYIKPASQLKILKGDPWHLEETIKCLQQNLCFLMCPSWSLSPHYWDCFLRNKTDSEDKIKLWCSVQKLQSSGNVQVHPAVKQQK